MQKKYIAIPIRLPEDLHKKVLELSEKNDRSLNKQMLFILKDWLDLTRNKNEMMSGEEKISAFSSVGNRPIPARTVKLSNGKKKNRLTAMASV